MSSRTYDYTLNVNFSSNQAVFKKGRTVLGALSGTVGTIVDVNSTLLKVKVDNAFTAFRTFEAINVISVTTTGGSSNLNVQPYQSPYYSNTVRVANAVVSEITRSNFIAAKNAFLQDPLVRLYEIYYPGEWYPANANNNPSNDGAGHPWPVGFPYKFCQIIGDSISDIEYKAYFNGNEYTPLPIELSAIELDSEAKTNDVTIKISNYDALIATLVEDPFLVGICSNGINATVNGEEVRGIDPKSIPANVNYNASYVAGYYGSNNNSPFTKTSCDLAGGTWVKLKQDTRDLLGAFIKIKTTYAGMLDVWPEYSQIRQVSGNVIELYSSLPYRPGDNVRSKSNTSMKEVIAKIDGNQIQLSNSNTQFRIGDMMFIINESADTEAYLEDSFKVDSLRALNGSTAEFSLTSWLQYFKLSLPKRRYTKNTCYWVYRGAECQYPATSNATMNANIPGTNPVKKANGYFNINNIRVSTVEEDACAHNPLACELRNNAIHFGGFPATGGSLNIV